MLTILEFIEDSRFVIYSTVLSLKEVLKKEKQKPPFLKNGFCRF
jgi:hypothetical protein